MSVRACGITALLCCGTAAAILAITLRRCGAGMERLAAELAALRSLAGDLDNVVTHMGIARDDPEYQVPRIRAIQEVASRLRAPLVTDDEPQVEMWLQAKKK